MEEVGVLSANNIAVELFHEVRKRSLKLAEPLNKEDFIPQPAIFASPPKWHLAHITWFFEEFILKRHKQDYQVFDPSFSFLFNSYYNSIGDRTERMDRGSITRPTVDEVLAYRSHVDSSMQQLFDSGRAESEEMQELLQIGLNHEQQHQELFLTDLKFSFGLNPTFPVYHEEFDLTSGKNKLTGWIDIQEGVQEVGHEGEGFCFDNELGRHKVYLQDYSISKGLVTNGEFLEFMRAGGYDDFRFWLDEGWSWIKENGVESPMYWQKIDDEWCYYTLAGIKKLDPHSILTHVSYYEAEAYARWRGYRLPTEFEWEAAAPQFNWGERWEWTQSAYLPYPGFSIAEGALGEYNGKFMVNQMVLRGASAATAPGHSRLTYRNFFHPHYQWQYSGIRLAK